MYVLLFQFASHLLGSVRVFVIQNSWLTSHTAAAVVAAFVSVVVVHHLARTTTTSLLYILLFIREPKCHTARNESKTETMSELFAFICVAIFDARWRPQHT